MAIQKTVGLLLKKRDLRETSLIVSYFTRDFGKINGVLKGARGSRARSVIKPLFFSLDQVVFYENKRDIFTISQCETERIFLNILQDWDRAHIAYYIIELVDIFTEPGSEDKGLFENMLNAFISLDNKKEPLSVARLFEVKFLGSLGLWPGRDMYKLTKGAMSTLKNFEESNWELSSKIKLASDVEQEIRNVTEDIINKNLDRPLKTSKVFKG
ncbi:MAG: DNA repair protein RecO [Candidatus Omnitrophota bacterium]